MAAKARRLTVTLPDGAVATRMTHHDYTHVVAVEAGPATSWTGWAALAWSKSFKGATKRAREAAKYGVPRIWSAVRVVEVTRPCSIPTESA